MKYTQKKVDYIVSLAESDEYTIKELCQLAKIHHSTWAEWKEKHPEFYPQIEAAWQRRLDDLRVAARKGLMRLLKGETVEETYTEFVERETGQKVNANGDIEKIYAPRIRVKRVTKKHYLPNPTAVIFASKNLDPVNFGEGVEDTAKLPPLSVKVEILHNGSASVPVATDEDDIAD